MSMPTIRILQVLLVCCCFATIVAFTIRSTTSARLLQHAAGKKHRCISVQRQHPQSLVTLRAVPNVAGTSSIPWKSVVSTNPDLQEAIDEIIAAAKNDPDSNKYNLAMFFTSTIYEATAFRYDAMFETLSKSMPSMKIMIGCTAGAVVGPMVGDVKGEPVEVEARASIGVTFAALDDDIEASAFYVDADEMAKYIKDKNSPSVLPKANSAAASSADAGSLALLFATEQAKPNIAQFVTAMGDKEGVEVFGAVASAVTSLHIPRVYIATTAGGNVLQRYSTGVAGLLLRGNVCVETVVARSCMPVGPLFSVTEVAGPTGREIMMVQRATTDADATTALPRSPLEQLEDVINEVSNDQAYMVKRELLVGLVPDSAASLRAIGQPNIMASKTFFGQKPINFDALTGSITVSSSPGVGSSFQFLIRDNAAARQDLLVAKDKLRDILTSSASSGSTPLALFMIGSMERGNKVFRYQSFEALQLHGQLQTAGVANSVPIAGLFSLGSFARLKSWNENGAMGGSGNSNGDGGMTGAQCALMEADSVYAFLAKQPTQTKTSSTTSTGDKNAPALSYSPAATGASVATEDLCTPSEALQFNDELDSVIVSKRDPESANPVRVASMDYFIPEKVPQPKNVLESLVWDREKEVDRMRERFQLARALQQAKASEAKNNKRDLVKAVREVNARSAMLSSPGGGIPPLILEINRASLHNGKLSEEGLPGHERAATVMAEMIKECLAAGAVAVGCHADAGIFRGSFEDLEVVRSTVVASSAPNTPVVCNDFVVYAYQLFRAKSSGADAVKIMASVLPVQDIDYLVKIAKALGLLCVVVVSSKVQLLDVLQGVPTLQALSVTSRNMRLWKIDPNKASRILTDPEVAAALSAKRTSSAASAAASGTPTDEGGFILLQEGFTSHAELVEAKTNGVDAVILGEELLLGVKIGLTTAIERWKQP